MATFTELVKMRRKAGGSVGTSLSYGLKERAKETFDPRRMFDQNGLLTALFPKLRSYKAGKNLEKSRKISPKGLSSPDLSDSNKTLDLVQKNTKIIAKNSLVLPAMHRDINVMRQNIIKLVKLKGGTATNKADMYFVRASTAEAAYENLLEKNKTEKSPSASKKDDKSPKKENEEGLFSGLLLPLFSLVTSVVTTIISLATTLITAVVNLISNPAALLALLGLGVAGATSALPPGSLGGTADVIRQLFGNQKKKKKKQSNDGQGGPTQEDIDGVGANGKKTSGDNTDSKTPKKNAADKLANSLDIIEEETGGNYADKFGKPLAGAAGGAYVGNKVGKFAYGKYQQNKKINEKVEKKLTETKKPTTSEPKPKRPLYDKKIRSDAALKKAEEGAIKKAEGLYGKVKTAYDKLAKKGLATKFAKRLVSRLWKMGKWLMVKLVGKLIVSLVVTVGSAGFGAAVGALIMASNVYDVITMLEICLEIYKEIMDEEGESEEKSPEPEPEKKESPTTTPIPAPTKTTKEDATTEKTETAAAKTTPEYKPKREGFSGWRSTTPKEQNNNQDENVIFKGWKGSSNDTSRGDSGFKVANVTKDIRDIKREEMRPVVNVSKVTDSQSAVQQTQQNSQTASVYDVEFLKHLGLSTTFGNVA